MPSLKERIAEAKAKAAAASGGNSDKKIVKLGNGTHEIKFLMPQGRKWTPSDEDNCDAFWEEFVVDYKNAKNPKFEYTGPKTYFAVPGVIHGSSNPDLIDRNNVVYIQLNGIQLDQLTDLAAMKKKGAYINDTLFDVNGPYVTITTTDKPKYKTSMVTGDDDLDVSSAKFPEATIEEATAWASGGGRDSGSKDDEELAFA